MRAVRRVALLVIALAALPLLAGCGVKDDTGAAAFPARAVDAAGTPITVPAAPARIVSLDDGATAILRDVGLGDATVAATPAAALAAVGDPTTALVVVGLGADPDLVGRIDDATTAPIYRYGADPLTDAPTSIVQLGLAVGRGPEAARIADGVARGLATLADRVASRGAVRTLIEGPGFTALGTGTPLGRAVAAAGGVNVVDTGGVLDPTAVTALGVHAWVAAQPGGSALTDLRGIAELAAVPAVAEGRVIRAPADGYPVDAALPNALLTLSDELHASPVRVE